MKEHVNCNLCDADEFKVVFPTKFGQIVKCSKCGFMYSNPREYTDPRTVDRYYNDTHLHDQYLRKQFLQIKDYRKILPIINSYHPNKGRLLEIGSYVGTFLKLAQEDGWDVVGIEPSGWCVEYAKEQLGLNLLTTLLRDACFPSETFEVVVMLHVIEHLGDPSSEVSEIHRILKPSGLLVIETPRYDTIWFKLFRDRERSVMRDHYYYYTRSTLRDLLEQKGMTPVLINTVGRTLTLDRLFFHIVRAMRNEQLSRIYGHLSPKLRLDKLRFHLNIRDMMRVYSVKK